MEYFIHFLLWILLGGLFIRPGGWLFALPVRIAEVEGECSIPPWCPPFFYFPFWLFPFLPWYLSHNTDKYFPLHCQKTIVCQMLTSCAMEDGREFWELPFTQMAVTLHLQWGNKAGQTWLWLEGVAIWFVDILFPNNINSMVTPFYNHNCGHAGGEIVKFPTPNNRIWTAINVPITSGINEWKIKEFAIISSINRWKISRKQY